MIYHYTIMWPVSSRSNDLFILYSICRMRRSYDLSFYRSHNLFVLITHFIRLDKINRLTCLIILLGRTTYMKHMKYKINRSYTSQPIHIIDKTGRIYFIRCTCLRDEIGTTWFIYKMNMSICIQRIHLIFHIGRATFSSYICNYLIDRLIESII